MEEDRKKFYEDVKNAENKSNKISIDYKHPVVVLLVAVIAKLFLYFTLSPYQIVNGMQCQEVVFIHIVLSLLVGDYKYYSSINAIIIGTLLITILKNLIKTMILPKIGLCFFLIISPILLINSISYLITLYTLVLSQFNCLVIAETHLINKIPHLT